MYLAKNETPNPIIFLQIYERVHSSKNQEQNLAEMTGTLGQGK